jgi:cyanophycinase
MSETILMAIGGGNIEEADAVLQKFLDLLKEAADPKVVVMTVATNLPEDAARKYDSLFRRFGIPHVSVVDVSERADAFDKRALKRIEEADALFFTGGDQLNVTSLLGGSPLHNRIYERYKEGFLIAGTSAGAMMMSHSMITTGDSENPPRMGGVEIGPGMDLISGTIIDTHFSQRGRYGRLVTAVAHYPQTLGIGIDEQTAIVVRKKKFEVVGEGVVTIMDASQVRHSSLPYRKEGTPFGLVGLTVHVLPAGYRFDLEKREYVAPSRKMAGVGER